jgi:hypothetical protein
MKALICFFVQTEVRFWGNSAHLLWDNTVHMATAENYTATLLYKNYIFY